MQSFLAALCDAMQNGQTDRGKQDLFAHSLLMEGRSSLCARKKFNDAVLKTKDIR